MGRDPVKGGQTEEEDMKAEGRGSKRGERDGHVRLIVNKCLLSLFNFLISGTVAREPPWCWVEFPMKNGLCSHNRQGKKAWRIKCCVTLCAQERETVRGKAT